MLCLPPARARSLVAASAAVRASELRWRGQGEHEVREEVQSTRVVLQGVQLPPSRGCTLEGVGGSLPAGLVDAVVEVGVLVPQLREKRERE